MRDFTGGAESGNAKRRRRPPGGDEGVSSGMAVRTLAGDPGGWGKFKRRRKDRWPPMVKNRGNGRRPKGSTSDGNEGAIARRE